MNKWDKLGMDIAIRMSEMSKDPSTKVGACVMRDKFIISQGFNGPPQGLSSDLTATREEKIAISLHAELNTVLLARESLDGCTLYVTHYPCSQCASVIAQVGIAKVVHLPADPEFADRWAESNKHATSTFNKRGVVVEEYEL